MSDHENGRNTSNLEEGTRLVGVIRAADPGGSLNDTVNDLLVCLLENILLNVRLSHLAIGAPVLSGYWVSHACENDYHVILLAADLGKSSVKLGGVLYFNYLCHFILYILYILKILNSYS